MQRPLTPVSGQLRVLALPRVLAEQAGGRLLIVQRCTVQLSAAMSDAATIIVRS
jgi:hypothetical protein